MERMKMGLENLPPQEKQESWADRQLHELRQALTDFKDTEDDTFGPLESTGAGLGGNNQKRDERIAREVAQRRKDSRAPLEKALKEFAGSWGFEIKKKSAK